MVELPDPVGAQGIQFGYPHGTPESTKLGRGAVTMMVIGPESTSFAFHRADVTEP